MNIIDARKMNAEEIAALLKKKAYRAYRQPAIRCGANT